MILITYPEIVQNEHEWLHLFFENGLQTLHVRKPGLSEGELKDYIRRIDPKYHHRLMLHHHLGLVAEFGLKGISFTETTKPQHSEYAELEIKRCWAAHRIEELDQIPSDIDYVFLSPLFPSISKKGYERSWQISELKAYLKIHKKSFDIVALGGIDHLNYAEALQIGLDDVAVLGCLWEPVINGAGKDEVMEIFNQLNSISSGDFSPLNPSSTTPSRGRQSSLHRLKGEVAEPFPQSKESKTSLLRDVEETICKLEGRTPKKQHQSTDFQCSPEFIPLKAGGARGKEH